MTLLPMRMLRQALASALSLLLAAPAGLAPAWAAADAAAARVTLDGVEVGADQVTLKLSGAAKYNTFVTANPPRLVLELLNTEAALSTRLVDGKGQFLKRVRAGQFAGEPNPIARIVLDLSKAVNYRVSASGSDLLVRLEGEAAAGAPAPEPAAAGKVAESKPDTAKAAAKPAAAKPAAKAPAAAKAVAAAPIAAAAKTASAAPRATLAKMETAAPDAAPTAAKTPEAVVAAAKRVAATAPVPSAASDSKPFSTEASGELVEAGMAQRDAAIAERTESAVSYASGARRRRDILATLPREPISLDLDDADVRDALKMLGGRANLNLIYGPEVAGSVSVHLDKVPFAEAFNIVLGMNKLVANQVGDNILQITTLTALKDSRSKSIGLTRVFPVYYSDPKELKTAIDAVRTAEGRTGNVVVDNKTNSLVITDSADGLDSIERLLAQLDVRPRQVLIEAKLVEVKLNKDLNLGIQWDYMSIDVGKALGKQGNTTIGTIPGLPNPFVNPRQGSGLDQNSLTFNGLSGQGSVGAGGRGTGVSLAADKVFGALTLGRITNNYLLSATLTAAASQGKAKVLSDPKIATLNGKEAKINITTQTPYVTSSVTPTGVVSNNVSYILTGIQLSVTPRINADGRVTLDVKPTVSQPSSVGALAGSAPAVDSRNAETNVIVKDGETIVIGGLITDSVSDTIAKVPLLGDIPILGWLFKKKSTSRSRVELLIFVTPKILPD